MVELVKMRVAAASPFVLMMTLLIAKSPRSLKAFICHPLHRISSSQYHQSLIWKQPSESHRSFSLNRDAAESSPQLISQVTFSNNSEVDIVTDRIMVQQMYETLKSTHLCGASCVIVQSPPPATLMFRFSNEDNFKATQMVDTNSDSEPDVKGINNKGEKPQNMDCSYSIDSFSVIDDDISTEELCFGRIKEQNNKKRLNKFIGGRIALRRALKLIDKGDSPNIFRDQYGAPILPDGIIGSISHKDDIAVGVAACNKLGKIGVDVERCQNKAAYALSRRLLTEKEQQSLGQITGISAEEEVLLRFSFKESVFKAIHPFLLRHVGFTEVEVDPRADGTAAITFLLKTNETYRYEAVWLRFNDKYWITCVYFDNPTPGAPSISDLLPPTI